MFEAHFIFPSAYELYADPKSNRYRPPGYKSVSDQSWLKTLLKPLHLRRRKKAKDSASDQSKVADMAEPRRKEVTHSLANEPQGIDMAKRFKETFSRGNVRVHFIGVWCVCPGLLSLPLLTLRCRDTVSSVGIVKKKSLPLTDTADHVCFFRHALALDERRVKFLPECVYGRQAEKEQWAEKDELFTLSKDSVKLADSDIPHITSSRRPRIKEVWFPGTHSDM